MLKRLFWAICLFALVLPTSTSAGIVSIGPFAGDLSEGFQFRLSQLSDPSNLKVFGGAATLKADSGVVSTAWLFEAGMFPFEASHFYGAETGPATYEFQTPVSAFGGYFGTHSVDQSMDAPDATANFYNMANALISSENIALGNGGAWTWNGWQANAGEQIRTIEIVGATYNGAYVHMDAMQAVSVPEPPSLLAGLISSIVGCGVWARRRFVRR